MQLSAKTQNACLAMIELARRHSNPQPVCLKTIAEEQKISSQFLVQILLQLKRGGLVQSTRGASGGYRLARDPFSISLLEIIQAIEGVGETALPTNATAAAGILHETWNEVTEAHFERLSAITLASLADRIPSRSGDMYYI